MVAFVLFYDRCIRHISRPRERQASHLLVAEHIRHFVKQTIILRTIERGNANVHAPAVTWLAQLVTGKIEEVWTISEMIRE